MPLSARDKADLHLACERAARKAAETAASEEARVAHLLTADRHANAAYALLNAVQDRFARNWK
jgi:hypothetical protein